MRTETGVVLYRGPSALDGQPIVAIAVFRSKNPKTGDMIQTWIIRDDMNPIEASKTGADYSICGDCPHRGKATGTKAVGRSCYVSLIAAPTQIYKSYKSGRYKDYDPSKHAHLIRGRTIRLGAYGDPVAVPFKAWESILRYSVGWSGYTHAWRNPIAEDFRPYCMASADSVVDAMEAQALGWRTFRIKLDTMPTLPNEFNCPASTEYQEAHPNKQHVTCNQCRKCDGSNNAAKNVVINAHGGKGVLVNVNRLIEQGISVGAGVG